MPELFNPDLPGVAIGDAPAWRRSGWRDWDDLSPGEQEAHKAAVTDAAEAEAAAVKERLDRWQAAVDAAAETTAEPEKPAPEKEQSRKPRQTPSTGDTPKE